MSARSRRWGIVPSYHGWQGDLVETEPATEDAILAALGANSDRPPRRRLIRLAEERCAPSPERAWGWGVQLYAMRSRDSWGAGDFADLRRFARWSRRSGASAILLNPLAAQNPTFPYQPSPYYASTRRFRNVIYLRVEEVPGAELAAASVASLRTEALILNRLPLIDYDAVFRLKLKALEAIFQAAPEPAGLTAWTRAQGAALRDFATFCALSEVHGPAWRDWPAGIRRVDGPGIDAARRELATRVSFHQWLQFHADRQLARASREIGLITDVPVGFASDGFDAWRWQDLLAPGMRVGVPPDAMFRDGQDWGAPAFDPWKLARAKFEPFVETLRSATAHAAGIRLDHVMGLFRLFWIPDGMTASDGAYVRYPARSLLALLAAESRRAGAFVIGEDLGLVEPAVRRHLRRIGSLSYRLLWFETAPPGRWPRDALAALTTHDLPTLAGLWNLSDPEPRLHHLRERLVAITRLTDEADRIDVAVATYSALARVRSRIVLATLDDALGVEERPNIPASTGRPNWRLALPAALEQVEQADGVLRIAAAMRAAGRSISSR
ncbi:MAG TPA: 4-alpha-glucanotransferase [Patescibacteria group bacterium]|nr:4-alpha-glucanotransferase [Patescibacteria group bacterium]